MTLRRIVTIFCLTVLAPLSCKDPSRGSDPQALDQRPAELTFISYNTYLLQRLGLRTHALERAKMIGEAIAAYDADFLLLQEVWNGDEDGPKAELLQSLKSHGYTSLQDFTPGEDSPHHSELGNGLLVASKYKLTQAIFLPWQTITRQAETASVKGVLLTEAEIPGLGTIQIFNAHTSTKQLKDGAFDSQHIDKRIEQIEQLKAWMKAQDHDQISAQILGIDLNTHPYKMVDGNYSDEVARDFTAMISGPWQPMFDVFKVAKENPTWDPGNFWIKAGLFPNQKPALLDYLIYKAKCCTTDAFQRVMDARFVIQSHYFDGFEAPFADHYGVQGRLRIGENAPPKKTTPQQIDPAVIEESTSGRFYSRTCCVCRRQRYQEDGLVLDTKLSDEPSVQVYSQASCRNRKVNQVGENENGFATYVKLSDCRGIKFRASYCNIDPNDPPSHWDQRKGQWVAAFPDDV